MVSIVSQFDHAEGGKTRSGVAGCRFGDFQRKSDRISRLQAKKCARRTTESFLNRKKEHSVLKRARRKAKMSLHAKRRPW